MIDARRLMRGRSGVSGGVAGMEVLIFMRLTAGDCVALAERQLALLWGNFSFSVRLNVIENNYRCKVRKPYVAWAIDG